VQIIEEDRQRCARPCRLKVGEHTVENRLLAGQHLARAGGGQHSGGQHRQVIGARRASEHLAPRPVRRRLREIVAATGEQQRPPLPGLGADRLGEAGLAHARLATDQDEGAVPGERRVKGIAQRSQLAITADE
jgi:hypothetical protein